MMERSVFDSGHESFRDALRRFMDKEIAPFHAQWEEQGYVDRAVWRKAGGNGFLCMTMPEAYGGSGADKLFGGADGRAGAWRFLGDWLRTAQRNRRALHSSLRRRSAKAEVSAPTCMRKND